MDITAQGPVATEALADSLRLTFRTADGQQLTLNLPAASFLPALPRLIQCAHVLQTEPLAKSPGGNVAQVATRKPESLAFQIDTLTQDLLLCFDPKTPHQYVLQMTAPQFQQLVQGGQAALQALRTPDIQGRGSH
jgi:hypothetical protein